LPRRFQSCRGCLAVAMDATIAERCVVVVGIAMVPGAARVLSIIKYRPAWTDASYMNAMSFAKGVGGSVRVPPTTTSKHRNQRRNNLRRSHRHHTPRRPSSSCTPSWTTCTPSWTSSLRPCRLSWWLCATFSVPTSWRCEALCAPVSARILGAIFSGVCCARAGLPRRQPFVTRFFRGWFQAWPRINIGKGKSGQGMEGKMRDTFWRPPRHTFRHERKATNYPSPFVRSGRRATIRNPFFY